MDKRICWRGFVIFIFIGLYFMGIMKLIMMSVLLEMMMMMVALHRYNDDDGDDILDYGW